MATNLQPYKFYVFKPDYYSFVTSSGVEYLCYFTPYAEYFKKYSTDISSRFYAFNLELSNKKLKPHGIDRRIADTVITIVGDFLNAQINAVVYVCDNSDGREAARSRKFLSWFDYYEHPSSKIIQVSNNFDSGGLFIYTTLLVHKKNKRIKDIILAYLDLTEENEK